jgi:hypothetical protein
MPDTLIALPLFSYTPMRKVPRSIHEGARDIAKTEAYQVSRREPKKLEMLFAHLKRILGLERLRLREPRGRAPAHPGHGSGSTPNRTSDAQIR